MSKYGTFFLMLCALVFLPSCMKVNIRTNTIADQHHLPGGFVPGSSFVIMSFNEQEPMIAKEVLAKITNSLENKGFIVTEYAQADYVLGFDFTKKSSNHIGYEPHYTGGDVKVTNGSSWSSRFGSSGYTETTSSLGSLYYIPYEYTLFHHALIMYIYDLNFCRTMVKAKQEDCSVIEQYIAWLTGSNSKTVSTKEVMPKAQVWQATVSSYGENADLRKAVDYLLVAAFTYFGKDTHGDVTHVIGQGDKDKLSLLCKRTAVSI